MTPPRRRSSRLRAGNRTPSRKANTFNCNRLSALAERDEAEAPFKNYHESIHIEVSSPPAPQTPATGRLMPSREEMHPSLAHQSTAAGPDSGLRLGFKDATSNDAYAGGGPLNTPTKVNVGPPPSSAFDFRFAQLAPELGPEAQRMMNDIREEALRIKSKLAAERADKPKETSNRLDGRKIALPKGKVGRFSDVHMADFKKMDSIANHPSSFRAQPGRFVPVVGSLKRTQSKANLDDRENSQSGSSSAPAPLNTEKQLRTPVKRVRKSKDTARMQPSPPIETRTPQGSHTRPTLLDAITTPTQASLARAASIQGGKFSGIPRSSSKIQPRGGTPAKPVNSATGTGLTSAIHSMSDSSGKVPYKAFAKTPSKLELNKDLPPVPGTAPRQERSKYEISTPFKSNMVHSPSPVKSGIPRSKSSATMSQRFEVETMYPSLTAKRNDNGPPQYPTLKSDHSLRVSPHKDVIPLQPEAIPSSFTFRSDQTINFGQSSHAFGSSPGQVSIRQVRPSMAPQQMPGAFPNEKENQRPLPTIAHGMANKKRHRNTSDEEEGCAEPSPKKQRGHPAKDSSFDLELQAKVEAEASAPSSRIPSPAKKGVLSLSRLNMLARPKMRR